MIGLGFGVKHTAHLQNRGVLIVVGPWLFGFDLVLAGKVVAQ